MGYHCPQYVLRLCYLALTMCLIGAMAAPLSAAPHPADTSADQAISLEEVSAYAAAWKTGATWPSGPSPISDAYYHQAVFIWQNGEAYRESADAAAPYHWLPDPGNGVVYLPSSGLSARPFDFITVTGIDPALELEVTFTLENEPGVFKTLWSPVDPSDLEILVPLNPYTFSGEGVVRFEIRDSVSGATWRLQPLQLEALPPAPGATQAVLASYATEFDSAAINLGHNLQDADAYDLGNVPEAARPLVYIKAWLDHPDNPGSLANLVGGLAPEELDLSDRILGKLNLGAASPAVFAQAAEAVVEAAPHDALALITSSGSGNEFLEIANAAELAQAMLDQAAAETSVKDQFSPRDGVNDLLNLQGNASAAADIFAKIKGVKPSGAGGGVLAAISITLMVADFFDHFDAGNLPSHFTNLELSIDGPGRGYFLEDVTGCDTATITAKATAASSGFDMLKTLGAIAPGGVLGRPGLKDGFAWADKQFPNLDDLDNKSKVWSGISIGGDFFSTTEADDKFEILGYNAGKIGMDFKPAKVGVGVLTVRANASEFSGNTIVNSSQYRTAPIQVEIVAPILEVGGDEASVTYQARLTDAAQTGSGDLEWIASAGAVTNPRSLGGGTYEMDWIPPSNESNYPVTITARSTTKKCLRAFSAEERKDSIRVTLDSWEILPAVSCIGNGDTIIFIAESTSSESVEVIWSVVSGDGVIDPASGSFTAGPTDGPVTVRATRSGPGAPIASKEVTFNVGCELTVAWSLEPADGPMQAATVHPRIGGFILTGGSGTETDAVASDLFVTYGTVTPPADGGLIGTVAGSFTGAGVFQSHDQALMASLVDDSNALKSYTGTDAFGSPYEYFVEAGFSSIDFENPENPVRLLDGPDGTRMEMRLDAGTASAGGVGNEIVAWNWFFSDGSEASGAVVTPSFDRGVGKFSARLVVVDRFGNSAEYIGGFLIVEMAGFFNFPYAPDATQVNSIFSGFDLPPFDTGDGIVEFTTDPDRCNISLFMDGGQSVTASARSSISGAVSDNVVPSYIIGFGG